MYKRNTTPVLSPGVLIEGTLDPQDLIPVFLEALEALEPVRAAEIGSQVPAGMGPYDLDWWYSEECQWTLDELAEALDDRAQRVGLAFGPLETDPACWGFWPVLDDEA